VIIGIALIAIAFTAVFMELYTWLINAIWYNDVVMANRWTIPVGVLVFSLLVGLCEKYLHAPNVIRGGFVDALKSGKLETDYRVFPGAFLSSLFSLLSGACIGPEGTITILVGQVSAWVRDRFRIAQESTELHLGFDVAALASAFNGIIGNPSSPALWQPSTRSAGKMPPRSFSGTWWPALWGTSSILPWDFLPSPQ